MNQYFEFKDLARYDFIEEHPTKNGKTITYRVPKSEGFSEESVETILKKYDIEFRPSGKPKMLRIRLKVHGVNRGTENEPDWEYDINTFEYPYSDAVLASCIDDFLDFENETTANLKKATYAMSGLNEKPIMTMLEDYAKRHGKIRLYEEPSYKTWLVCYEHCRGNANKDKTEKTIFTFCISCTDKERYIRDIYITKSYAELVDKLKNAMHYELQKYESRVEGEEYIPFWFCTNGSLELHGKMGIVFPDVLLSYDVSLIPMYFDAIIPTLKSKSKYRIMLEKTREELLDAFKECCHVKHDETERKKVMKKFTNVLLQLHSKRTLILIDNHKDCMDVFVKLEKVWNTLNSITDGWYLGPYGKNFGWKKYDRRLKWPESRASNIIDVMEAFYHPEFISMESYRIQYLLDVFLHKKKNISPERLRLKLLCNYDYSNKHSIDIENAYGTRKIILEPGKRPPKRNQTKEYRPLFSMVHVYSEKNELHISLPEKIYYFSGRRNVLLKGVCRGRKVICVNEPRMLSEYSFIFPRLYKYKVKLKPVPAPRISGPYATLSDVCKRLEKLVYDI